MGGAGSGRKKGVGEVKNKSKRKPMAVIIAKNRSKVKKQAAVGR